MLNSSNLKYLLNCQDISRKHKVLLLLSAEHQRTKTVAEIKILAAKHGLREIKKWNISQILASLGAKAIRLDNGWEITDWGNKELIDQELIFSSPIKRSQSHLRTYSELITSNNTVDFLMECISALELNLFRCAVILSWNGAISLLYNEIIENYLNDFNVELQKKYPKRKPVRSIDDLATVKEYDFLQIINSLSLIGKNVRQELEYCLKLRNACAHPSSLYIKEHRVAAHIEVLILNVYKKFVAT